ncbi:WD repeat-containing protein 97 isoform X2 [Mastacembelus armatus]|uniref:WD repeat-containing protein 97 isoform X2 n=1 Tax=Mastacembelus armatus TaxID=205130 RepID=UPI000E46134F|nr:WD repeat-containing protein 97 isoform X2 [Mastacembelus armatus]
MVAQGQESRTTAVLCPSPTLGLLSPGSGNTFGNQSLLTQAAKQATCMVTRSKETKEHVFTHGLHCIQHFPCGSPVRFMVYSEAAAAFIGIHSDNTVFLYQADGHKQTSSVHFPFMGLTSTKISGCLVGWGPGPIFTLLDSELRPLDAAEDALDIRVCQPAEHSTDLVTAGLGNVCVWSVRLMRCKVKIQKGLQQSTPTHMALACPRADRPHRAFVVCGRVVTVVDLDGGKVLDHRKDLCSCNITAIIYCSHLDCVIIASHEQSIRVWGPDWELRVVFVGHNGVVNSLFYCSELNMLLSASVDCTIRCWNVEEGDVVECVDTEQKSPPLYIGGTSKGDILFSFSHQGVDFWSIRNIYNLHCKLKGDKGASLKQILVSSFPPPYPIRVLCVSGDSDINLVAAETGAVLTSFKTQQRILCADYCLHKEILLALSEAGTVLQANTLTNPITLMQQWKGRGQGPWQKEDRVSEDDRQNLTIPGPASCLAVYTLVTDARGTLEEWRNLQERRGCSHRSKIILDDAKNRCLIILGQNGGCVSVLKLDNGKVWYRTPAHNGQSVTSLQVYPTDGYLLSTGEDMTVIVWRVNPYVEECLSQQLSLHSGQPHVHLATLGPLLALTFQEPKSGTNSLMHFDLLNQNQTGQLPREGHIDDFTGLCVCPDLELFVSSSLDGTVCIWNEKNQLIRTLQLNAVPECLAYGGFGELFFGIRGNLYKTNCAKFLPQLYQQMLIYTYYVKPLPDLPIAEKKENCSNTMSDGTAKNKEEASAKITRNQLMTEDIWMQEYESLMTSNMDLSALLQDTVKCKKRKPPSTNQTKKEAFDRYMRIIYGLPPKIKIDLTDTSDPDTFSFCPEPSDRRPLNLPKLNEKIRPESKQNILVNEEKKKVEKAQATSFELNQTELKTQVTLKPVEKVIPKKTIKVEKDDKPPENISPAEQPKPKTPHFLIPTQPPHPSRTPTQLPPRDPSPEVPNFLKQFADEDWFRDLYPNKKSISSTLSPEEFSLQLLECLNTCSTPSKLKILAALQDLHSQGLLHNTSKFYDGLFDLIPKLVRPHMSPLDQTVLIETLNLLVHLKSTSSDLVKKLLTLLAYKKLGLRRILLRMLTGLGVDEAEQWLLPELESWDSELQDPSDIWKSLHNRADDWLELWISKYKEYNRYLYLTSTSKWMPPIITTVDVLNYFCYVQKEEYRKARCVAPAGRKNTVVLSLYDCSSQPILRLGETYSMARSRRPPGITLPPLQNRPFLMHFPNFISLPLTRVTLYPFHNNSDEDWLKVLPRRYFIQQQSFVEYYR